MGMLNPAKVLSLWTILAPGVTPAEKSVYSEGFDSAELFTERNLCRNLLAPINGEINCYVSDYDTVCTAHCNRGFIFSDALEIEKTFSCANDLGIWDPVSEVPQCVRITQCLRAKMAAGEGEQSPQCDAQGDYESKQVDARSGESWCVDTQGKEIANTRRDSLDAEEADCSQFAKIPSRPMIPTHMDLDGACVHWDDVWYKTFDGQIYGYGVEGPLILLKSRDGQFSITMLPLQNFGSDSHAKRWIEFRKGNKLFTLRFLDGKFVIASEGQILSNFDEPLELKGGFIVTFDGEWVTVTNPESYGKSVFMFCPLSGSHFIKTTKSFSDTEGLCGSFDNDVENDFLAKNGNICSESSEFAETWQMTCPVRPYWKTYETTGAAKRSVEFINNFEEAIKLYVVTMDGSWEKMAEIDQFASYEAKKTYSTVAWIATTKSNELLKLNNYCVFYALETEDLQHVSITTAEPEEGFAVHYEKKCNAIAPVNGHVECKTFGGLKMCAVNCDNGYQHGHTSLYICNLETGTWAPELPYNQLIFPACHDGARRCTDLEAPIGGTITCSINDEGLQICVPSCPEGFEIKPSPPMSGYYTCNDGRWGIGSVPPACIARANAVDPREIGQVSGVFTKGDVPADQTGYCMTWGQHHYRTFDGKIYRFRGQCSYVLAQDKLTGSFSIHIKNDGECDGTGTCRRSLTIFMNDASVDIKLDEDGQPTVYTASGEAVPLPTMIYDLSIQRISDYIVVREAINGWYLKWDGAESVFLRMDEGMMGQTSGLCGVFDRDQSNDFETRSGTLVKTVSLFANSWKIDQNCLDATEEGYCSIKDEVSARKATEAIMLCSYLLDTECKDTVDPRPYFESCKEDVCFSSGNNTEEWICNSMSAYFRECARHDVHVDWRCPARCEVQCPVGQIFKTCGSSCPQTCWAQQYNCDDDHCIDGCHCPAGTYLHDGQCLQRGECPCKFGHDEYAPRSRIQRDCNQCVCVNGGWKCTTNECDGVCTAMGSHYTTFDGIHYDFEGDCTYVLSRGFGDFTWEVLIQNHDCSGSVCGRSVILRVNGEDVKLIAGGALHATDSVTSLPYHGEYFVIEKVTTMFHKVTLDNGLTIFWDKTDRIYLRAPASIKGSVSGLCGNFNDAQSDEFRTPENDIEANAVEFATKWQATTCDNAPQRVPMNACAQFANRRGHAQKICASILSGQFVQCHEIVDYEAYYGLCMQDYCKTGEEKSACTILSDYSSACAKNGIIVDGWRQNCTECNVECPHGMVFAECAKSCGRSCGSLSYADDCTEGCVQGCTCPEGSVMDFDGDCIPVGECPCYYEQKKYLAGESRMQDCNICECHKGQWFCTDNECEIEETCGVNAELNSCVPIDPLTCSNMHLNRIPLKVEHCRTGCVCMHGFVLDESTGDCVRPTECPCHHGGKSYKEGEEMKKDCNHCQCVSGSWECTDLVCPGHCRAYGDSHITTFDSRNYQFQGACEYTYVETVPSAHASFRVTARNEQCGSQGTVCTKSITITLNPENTMERSSLRLVRGKPITLEKGSGFDVRYAGLWVFITTDVGLTVQWDKGTQMIIKLDPMFKGKVQGLCGDYDDRVIDDLVSRGGISTANVLSFGDSWRVDSTCPPSKHVNDICEANPHRKIWAVKKCSIINSDTFAACHAHVDPSYYYDNCVFDSCACDSGGDCECLCTAIGAYAQECNRHGVHIYWRNQQLCPVQCDGCRSYDPCVSACPKSCDNYHNWAQIETTCPDTCVEGCTCDDEHVMSDDGKHCLPVDECICMEINGVVYGHGEKIDVMSDDCRSCFCMEGHAQCLGLPCGSAWTAPTVTTICPPDVHYEGMETKPFTTKTVEECPEGKKQECSFTCNMVCHAWRSVLVQCVHDTDTCVDICENDKPMQCASGYVLNDLNTCVKMQDCPCMLPCGQTLAPGSLYDDEDECKRYFCWQNDLKVQDIPGCSAKTTTTSTTTTSTTTTTTNPPTTTKPTMTTTSWTCPPISDPCIDKDGNERQFGEYWNSENCHYCMCYQDGSVRCRQLECDSLGECEPGAIRDIKMSTDGCCEVAECRAESCKGTECEFEVPCCEYYEDIITVQVSECCCRFECECNESKCEPFNDCYCEEGFTLQMQKQADSCCSVPTCIPDYASTTTTTSTTTTSTTTSTTTTDNTHTWTIPDIKIDTTTTTTTKVMPTYTHVTPTCPPLCFAVDGTEYEYGEQWTVSACETCCCRSDGTISCTKSSCQDIMVTCDADTHTKQTADLGCCKQEKCIPRECTDEQPTPPTCDACQECVATPTKNKCIPYTYTCVCKACPPVGELTCKAPYVAVEYDMDQCCKATRCCHGTTEPCTTETVTVTPPTHTPPTPGTKTTHPTMTWTHPVRHSDTTKIIVDPTHTVTHPTETPFTTTTMTKTPTPTHTTTICTTVTKVMCFDEEGNSRMYGEIWNVGACERCCCTAEGNVQCVEEQCKEHKCPQDSVETGTYNITPCCTAPTCCTDECKDVKCPAVVIPTCEVYEVCKSKTVDCCEEFYCECDKTRCFKLGDCDCPTGYELQSVVKGACCDTPKCVRIECTTTTHVPPTHTETIVSPTHTTTSTISCTPGSPTCPPPPKLCIDADGCERYYGENWSTPEEPCKVYTCYTVGDIKVTDRICQQTVAPVCEDNECEYVHKMDECCSVTTCVPTKCKNVDCNNNVPSCDVCEDLVITPTDDGCCCEYSCVCNLDNCIPVGACPCPAGYVASRHIPLGQCCETVTCIEIPTTTTTTECPTETTTTGGMDDHTTPSIPDIKIDTTTTTTTKVMPTNSHVTFTEPTHPIHTTKSMIEFSLVTESVCVDDEGNERCFGEIWYMEDCVSCCCTSEGTVSCQSINCPVRECSEGFTEVGRYDVDRCCDAPCCSQCTEETAGNCPDVSEKSCSCVQDQVQVYNADDCCFTYECVCNEDKCFTLDRECPTGYVKKLDYMVDDCCPVFKCVKGHTTTTTTKIMTPHTSTTGYPTTTPDPTWTTFTPPETHIDLCPGVIDKSRCPETCPTGYVCNGAECIHPSKCSCTYNGFFYASGQVWTIDNGCKTCFCTMGEVKCDAVQCDVTSCPTGFALRNVEGECCPTCEPCINSCVDETDGYSYFVGEQWSNCASPCDTCTCNEDLSITCVRQQCTQIIPICKANEKVVEITGACCPSYECVCDESSCDDTVLICESYEKLVELVSKTSCCSDFECQCDYKQCVIPECSADEELVNNGKINRCCDNYTCEKKGCNYNGQTYMYGEVVSQSACTTCTCQTNGLVSCEDVLCTVVKPICANGYEPTEIRGECCPTYVCGCTCSGFAGVGFTSFDSTSFTSTVVCTEVTVAQSIDGQFSISVYKNENSQIDYINVFSVEHGSLKISRSEAIQHILGQQSSTVSVSTGGEVNAHGFTVSRSYNEIRACIGSAQLAYTPCTGAWSVSVSAAYAGRMEGICGQCDGISDNDFTTAQYSTSASAVDYWTIYTNEECDDIICEDTTACDTTFSEVFDICSHVNTEIYQTVCNTVNCVDGSITTSIDDRVVNTTVDYTCESYAAYIRECQQETECFEWRTAEFCPGQCPAGMEFRTCGPDVIRTCDNYITYNSLKISYNSEGCFCPEGLIFKDGACVTCDECKACIDEDDVGRRIGEIWTDCSNPCIQHTCVAIGHISSSLISQCPAPIRCPAHCEKKLVSEDTCCEYYECYCEETECDEAPVCDCGEALVVSGEDVNGCPEYNCECDDNLCPTVTEPICGLGERSETKINGCCESKTCVCDPSTCPAITVTCGPQEKLIALNKNACCPEYTCVCDIFACSSTVPCCDDHETLKVVPDGNCCTKYICECDESRCPPAPVCNEGFELQTTKSGCCPTHKCVCDTSKCQLAARTPACVHSYEKLRLVSSVIVSACCPPVNTYECVCDINRCARPDIVCKSYETVITVPATEGECCPTYECACDYSQCPMAKNMAICEAGKSLRNIEINACCSTVQCVCDECVAPEECPKGTIAHESYNGCGCIERTCTAEPVCCVNEKIYECGETWTEDICTTCTCMEVSKGTYSAVCHETQCSTCSEGYILVPVEGECCGECVQDSCKYNDKTYAVGQTWSPSNDQCSTCCCVRDVLTGSVYTECSIVQCPEFDDSCPPEFIKTSEDGCCVTCERETSGCGVKVDYTDYVEADGCISKEVVQMTLCSGECTSTSIWSEAMNKYHKQCSCCTCTDTETKLVEMICPDNTSFTYELTVAKECSCMSSECTDEN